MIRARPCDARGSTHAGGLHRRHAFSRGDFFDPDWMGFGALRALDDIDIAPGAAQPAQRCANIDILSVVLSGALVVEGAAGMCEVHAGQAHWLGAGHGVDAGWRNASARDPLRLLQWWIQPERLNAAPASAQAAFAPPIDGWSWLAPPLPQRARWRMGRLQAGEGIAFAAEAAHRYWLQLASGEIAFGEGRVLRAGDGLGIEDEAGHFALRGLAGASEALLLELPA